jgi:hypothetical protein
MPDSGYGRAMLAPNRPDVLDEVFDGEAVLVNWGPAATTRSTPPPR